MRFTRVLLLVSLLALVVVPAALALRFSDDSYNMPQGATGQSYSKTFHGEGGCGPALPYQYRILAGALPTGLSLSKSGTISGVPTVGGKYDFWVELSDQDPPTASFCVVPAKAQREFAITILQGLNIQQNALNPQVATTNAPYSSQLTAEGGGTQTWSVVSGALPAGLALNSSNGVVSGTPTATGDYTFKIQVTDGSRTDAETYTLAVVAPLKIDKVPTAAEVGLAFAFKPNATGGRPGYTWSLEGTLPTGLAFDGATGAIGGKPTVAGSYPLKLVITDTLGLTQTSEVNLVVTPRLAITKRPLKAAKVGKAYKVKLLARGGLTPRTWNLLGGRPGYLPSGLRLNRKTGEISGTPTKAGIYSLRMQVVDKLGVKSAAGYVLKVSA
jgi:large repetitive protein